MSSLTSSSTDAQVWAEYDNNASYEEDESTTKAAAFITACRILLRRRPQATNVDGTAVTFEPGRITAEMEYARSWLANNRAAGGIRYLDFGDLRS